MCTKHGNVGDMICECKCEIICKDCYAEHAGIEHKKMFLSDIKSTLP